MRRKIAAYLAALMLAASLIIPAAASAHRSGYAGYGCSGWSYSGPYPWDQVQDCYAGQQSGRYVLIDHKYWGWGAPSNYQTWEPLY